MKKLEVVFKSDNSCEEKFNIEVACFSGNKLEFNKAVYHLWEDLVAFAKKEKSDHVRVTMYDFDTTDALMTRRYNPWEIYENWNEND